MILGIDEAGRGPVLGPMVLAGVWLDDEQQRALRSLGVRDSKSFGSGPRAKQRRSALAREIKRLARTRVQVISAAEIDRWVEGKGLNQLEQSVALEIIAEGPCASEIVADGRVLFEPLCRHYPQLKALDRADCHHLGVAAASLVAKAERDEALDQLLAPWSETFGPIGGGGYPNAGTASFLRAFARRYGTLPPLVRQSWSWPVLDVLRCELGSASSAPGARA
jgi:ribonuclease HII